MKYGFIYITTNKTNDKKYLGMCAYHKPNYSTYLGSGKVLKRAIKKYGKENFQREIIYEANSREELSEKEIELIKKYDCVNKKDWYNMAAGGYATRGFRNKTHSESTKALMRKNHRRPIYKSTREAFRKNAALIRPLALEANRKYKEEHGHGYNTKSVTVNGITYSSIKEYANAEGVAPSVASSRLKRREENIPARGFCLEGIFYKSAKDYADKHDIDYQKNRKKIRLLIANNLSGRRDPRKFDFSFS